MVWMLKEEGCGGGSAVGDGECEEGLYCGGGG